jgi:hypothetical protein
LIAYIKGRNRFKFFANRVLRKKFGLTVEKVIRVKRKCIKSSFVFCFPHMFYFSMWLRWAGHEARTREEACERGSGGETWRA